MQDACRVACFLGRRAKIKSDLFAPSLGLQ